MLNSITLHFSANTSMNMMTAEITACEDSQGPYFEVNVTHPHEDGPIEKPYYVAAKVCFSPAEVIACFCNDMGWDDAYKAAVEKTLQAAMDLYSLSVSVMHQLENR